MKHISHNVAFRITLGALASFWLLALVFAQWQMVEIANGLVLGGSLAVMLTWFPAARHAMVAGDGGGSNLLQMAIFGTGFALFCHRIWSYIVRWNGRPEWLLDSIYAAFAPWMLFVAIVMILLAPGTQEGEIPLRNYVWFVFAGVIGALFSGVAIGVSLVQIAN